MFINQKVKIRCDRCKKEFELDWDESFDSSCNMNSDSILRLERSSVYWDSNYRESKYGGHVKMDLCPECAISFYNWLDKTEN